MSKSIDQALIELIEIIDYAKNLGVDVDIRETAIELSKEFDVNPLDLILSYRDLCQGLIRIKTVYPSYKTK